MKTSPHRQDEYLSFIKKAKQICKDLNYLLPPYHNQFHDFYRLFGAAEVNSDGKPTYILLN